MKSQKGFTVIEMLIALVFSVVIIGGFIAGPMLSYSSVDTTTITVKDKERICESQSNCRYLIYTEQGVYENTDSLLHWKFNSSDVYNNLEEGEEYNVTVNWFRVPFLSSYQNILEINRGGF